MDAGEIIQAVFEEVHPGSANDYMDHPSIQKFLEETSLDEHGSAHSRQKKTNRVPRIQRQRLGSRAYKDMVWALFPGRRGRGTVLRRGGGAGWFGVFER